MAERTYTLAKTEGRHGAGLRDREAAGKKPQRLVTFGCGSNDGLRKLRADVQGPTRGEFSHVERCKCKNYIVGGRGILALRNQWLWACITTRPHMGPYEEARTKARDCRRFLRALEAEPGGWTLCLANARTSNVLTGAMSMCGLPCRNWPDLLYQYPRINLVDYLYASLAAVKMNMNGEIEFRARTKNPTQHTCTEMRDERET